MILSVGTRNRERSKKLFKIGDRDVLKLKERAKAVMMSYLVTSKTLTVQKTQRMKNFLRL